MEPEITPNEPIEKSAPKVSKFTIILITLIVLSAAFLGYLVYKSNVESNTTNTSTDSTAVAEPVPTTVPGTATPPAGSIPKTDVVPNGASYIVAQVSEKDTKSACWTIINGNVYDITTYIPNHPGGEADIIQVCGKDGTALFAKPTEHKEGGASDVLAGFKIGRLIN